MPAKQSACNSIRTESGLRSEGSDRCKRLTCCVDAEHFLHVMADLVRDYVRLRELAGSAERRPNSSKKLRSRYTFSSAGQ